MPPKTMPSPRVASGSRTDAGTPVTVRRSVSPGAGRSLSRLGALLVGLFLLSGVAHSQQPSTATAPESLPELTVRNPFLMEDLELILWNPIPNAQVFFYLADALDVRDWVGPDGVLPGLDRLRTSRVIHETQAGELDLRINYAYALNDPALAGREFFAQAVLYDPQEGEWVRSNLVPFIVHSHALVVADAGRNSFSREPAVRIFEPGEGGRLNLETELPVGGIPGKMAFSGDLARVFVLTDAKRGVIEVVDCRTRERRELPRLGPGVAGMEATLDGTRLVVLVRQTNDRNSFAPPGRLYLFDTLGGELLWSCAVAPIAPGSYRPFAIDERRQTAWVSVDGLYVQPVSLIHGTAGPMQGVAAPDDQAIVDLQILEDTLLVLCRGREGADTSTLHFIGLGRLDYQAVALPGEARLMRDGPLLDGENPVGHGAFLMNRAGDRIWVVDVAARRVRETLPVPAGAREMAVAPAHGDLILLYPGVPSRGGEVGWLRVLALGTGRLRGEVDLGLSHQEGLVVLTLPGLEMAGFLVPATGRCRLIDLGSLDEGATAILVGLRPRRLEVR